MKALTICQPYAEMIVRGNKRVENRTWPTNYRGGIYIHAGKSRDWLDDDGKGIDFSCGIRIASMAFGAVVATARLEDCLHFDRIMRGEYDDKYPWLRNHEHTNGPWCWVLSCVSPVGPWPWRGAQGLFEIDDDALGDVANQTLGIAK